MRQPESDGRKIGIEYAGAVCHVLARGNQGRDIYADDQDRELWLEALAEGCEKTGWRIHAWVKRGAHAEVIGLREKLEEVYRHQATLEK